MIDVLLADDVRRQDALAAQMPGGVETLMERAGWAVARAARRLLGRTYGARVVIVCGKGNNGGDGLVAARHLRAAGVHTTVVLAAGDDLSELAALNRARFDGPVEPATRILEALARADLVVDALLGVGLRRAPEGAVRGAIVAIGTSGVPVLSVDVPSGVDADTGAVPGDAVRATATVTLGGLKPGLLFMPGRAHAGVVEVAPIGAPVDPEGRHAAMEPADVARSIPARTTSSHKRAIGTVLVVAGSRAMPGAAALATAAAVHGGAGLTTLCAPEDVCAVVLGHVPEITTIPVPASSEGTIDPKAMDLIRPRLDEFDAVACGPGLGRHPAATEMLRLLVAEVRAPLVLDADGISAFAGAADVLAARDGATILTPHAGEAARVSGSDVASIEADRLVAAASLAAAARATVVLKGPGTVVTDGARGLVNTTGDQGLAQGGTGDVLTGIVAAFVAAAARRGADLLEAVAAAVWLHGRAGDRLSACLRPHPANASALIDEIGPTMHEVTHA